MNRSRKSHQVLVIGAILLALTLAGCIGGRSTPRVEVAPASYDFGQVGPNPVTTVFTVRNEGNGPLQVESVSTSCGCTTAEMSAQAIAPGELANLTVTFDPQAHAGAVGQFVRFVYLRTNDPTTPEVEVQISANVVGKPISEEALQ
jgi:hypothetical protein